MRSRRSDKQKASSSKDPVSQDVVSSEVTVSQQVASSEDSESQQVASSQNPASQKTTANENLNPVSLDLFRWYVPNQLYDVKIRATGHRCGPCLATRKLISGERRVCRDDYACSCKKFVLKNEICEHIEKIELKMSELSNTPFEYGEDMRLLRDDVHLEQLMRDDARRDENDVFNYRDYFSNKSNFDLKLNNFNPERYWKGFELNVARHHYGMDLLRLNKCTQRNARQIYDFVDDEKHFVKILNTTINCQCKAFELCSTCRSCIHKMYCSCDDYRCGFFCRHCHAAVMFGAPGKRRPYQLRYLPRFYIHPRERWFFLNLTTRIRHNESLKKKPIILSSTQYIFWDVDNEGNKEAMEVRVKKDHKNCNCDELLKCFACGVCREGISCDCDDYRKKNFLCIHVHAVQMARKKLKVKTLLEIFREKIHTSLTSVVENEELKVDENHPNTAWPSNIKMNGRFLAYRHLFLNSHDERERAGIRVVYDLNNSIFLVGMEYSVLPEEREFFGREETLKRLLENENLKIDEEMAEDRDLERPSTSDMNKCSEG